MSWVVTDAMEGGTTTRVGEPPSMQAGAVLGGRYELGDLVGSGGMANVYAARDRVLGRDVALKVFRQLDAEIDRARFVGEARMLAALSHPGLITVYDASLDDRLPFLIMKLVDGGTLRQRIDTSGRLASGQVATLGACLATALGHVHANGIVHRDVKPSNVLIDSAGDYYLADFGLAWALGTAHLTNSGEVVGTAYYLAPEQVTGTTVGPEADIYALGLVLLECLTGRTEYEGTTVEIAVARLSRPPIVPEDLDPAWARLLTAMTAYHPAERPDATECARYLRALAQAPAATLDTADTPDTADTGRRAKASPRAARTSTARQLQPRKPSRTARTASRSRPGGRLYTGLGAAGAASVMLTVLMVTTPTSPTGEPSPDSSPNQSTAVPTQDNDPVPDRDAPGSARNAPAQAPTPHPQAGTQASKATESAVVTAPADKPTKDAKARGKGPAGPHPAKPDKAK